MSRCWATFAPVCKRTASVAALREGILFIDLMDPPSVDRPPASSRKHNWTEWLLVWFVNGSERRVRGSQTMQLHSHAASASQTSLIASTLTGYRDVSSPELIFKQSQRGGRELALADTRRTKCWKSDSTGLRGVARYCGAHFTNVRRMPDSLPNVVAALD